MTGRTVAMAAGLVLLGLISGGTALFMTLRSSPATVRLVVSDQIKRRRAELVQELQPTSLSNCQWVRVGSLNDGGYAMCGNLLDGIETAYSYGIGRNDEWGCQISLALKVPVHQYDCFSPVSVPCLRGDLRLKAECIGPRAETIDNRPFDSLASQIARNGDTGKRMIVKMDVEGAEWASLLAAPDALFDSIVQMPMELHGTDEQEVLDGLRRLKRHFYLVSVHFNNYRNCSGEFAPLPDYAYQVLFVNKKVGIPGSPPAGSPTRDSVLAPDNPQAPDCVTTVGR